MNEKGHSYQNLNVSPSYPECEYCGYPVYEAEADFEGETLKVFFCLNPDCDWSSATCPKRLDELGDLMYILPFEEWRECYEKEFFNLLDAVTEWSEKQARIFKGFFFAKYPSEVRDVIARMKVEDIRRRWLFRRPIYPPIRKKYILFHLFTRIPILCELLSILRYLQLKKRCLREKYFSSN